MTCSVLLLAVKVILMASIIREHPLKQSSLLRRLANATCQGYGKRQSENIASPPSRVS